MEDSDAQNDEILALESILEETKMYVNRSDLQITGCIFVSPEIEGRVTIEASKNDHLMTLVLEHLCPFELHFTMPKTYPSSSPPIFTLVCKWLQRDQLSKLCKRMDQMWEEQLKGQVVLFDWIQFLQCEALTFLDFNGTLNLSWSYHQLVKPTDNLSESCSINNHFETSLTESHKTPKLDPRAVLDNQLKTDLLDFLVDYDKAEKQIVFEKTGHTCKVCFEEKLGSQCLQFLVCGHVSCKECLKSYFEVQIVDGAVNALSCPEEKCTSQASPGQVKELVSPDTFARYDSLLLESTIASMLNLTYCPRPKCQYPVSVEQEATMGSCPLCSFHFCVMCKAAYHGVAPCKMTSEDRIKLYDAYINGNDGEKENLERRYGKKQLLALIDNIQTEKWIGQHSKKCPHCGAPIEKKDGCNKMSCPRCSTFFCWLCLAQLDPRSPYLHFSSSNAKCDLFEGLVQDGMERDDWINLNDDSDDSDDLSDDEDLIALL